MPLQVHLSPIARLTAIAGFLAGCGTEPTEPDPGCDVPTVSVTGLPDPLPAWQPVQLTATVGPAICESEAVAWSASAGLTITADGQVTATHLGGPHTVTATVKGVNGTQSTNVTVAPPAADARWALAWVDDYNVEVDPAFSFSTGGAIVAGRRAAGAYFVRFPGLATGPGQREVVHVSAYGTDPRRCKVFDWSNTGADLSVEVSCRDFTGATADALFTILVIPAGRTQGRSGFVVSPPDGELIEAAAAHNSTGGGVGVVRDSLGRYTVTFAGLARDSFPAERETIHVTTYGAGTNWCKINNWNPLNADQVVGVACYDITGARADARFSVLLLAGSRLDRRLGYAWANLPAEDTYTPDSLWTFNSAEGAITATRPSAGVYDILFAGLDRGVGSTAETNLVTAYGGADPNSCQVGNWTTPIGAGMTRVLCFAPNGTAADARYVAIWIE